jgi:catechol 2,3-dioxygenase-like lactoylglutathione lyase family enzyme
MIVGAHAILYTTDAEADRAFFRDVLEFPYVDVGEGWLIFGLPPAEVGIHPHDKNDEHELYLMCDDVKAFVADMKKRKFRCGPISDQGYGIMTSVTLPGGGKLGVYQARHARPAPAAKPKSKPKAKRSAK